MVLAGHRLWDEEDRVGLRLQKIGRLEPEVLGHQLSETLFGDGEGTDDDRPRLTRLRAGRDVQGLASCQAGSLRYPHQPVH